MLGAAREPTSAATARHGAALALRRWSPACTCSSRPRGWPDACRTDWRPGGGAAAAGCALPRHRDVAPLVRVLAARRAASRADRGGRTSRRRCASSAAGPTPAGISRSPAAPLGGARLLVSVEEHGRGRQLVRCRVWPRRCRRWGAHAPRPRGCSSVCADRASRRTPRWRWPRMLVARRWRSPHGSARSARQGRSAALRREPRTVAAGSRPSTSARCADCACSTRSPGGRMRLPPRSRPRPARGRSSSTSARILPYLWPHQRLAAVSLGLVARRRRSTALLAPWPLAIVIDCVLGDKPLPGRAVARWTASALPAARGRRGRRAADHRPRARPRRHRQLRQHAGSTRTWCSTCAATCSRTPSGCSLAFHDRTRTGQLMFEINNQASAIGGITVAVPPLLQSVLTVVGMFVILVPDAADAGAAGADGRARHLLLSRLLRQTDPAARRSRCATCESMSLTIVHEAMAMMRVIVAFGRERLRVAALPCAGRAGGGGARRLDRAPDDVLAGRDDDDRRRQRAGARRRRRVGAAWRPQPRRTAGGDGLRGRRSTQPLEQISNTVSGLQKQFITLRGALRLLDTDPEIHERPDAIVLDRTPRPRHLRARQLQLRGPPRHARRRHASTLRPGRGSRSSAPPGPARARC